MDGKKIAGECPTCKSANTVLVNSTFNSGVYNDEMACEDCPAEWTEKFSYSSFVLKTK